MIPDRPDWPASEKENKSARVRIVIPDIEDLHRFAVEQSQPKTLAWEADMDEELISKYEIYLHADKNWAALDSSIIFSRPGDSWAIADRGKELASLLKTKRPRTKLVETRDGVNSIQISGEADNLIEFTLGHPTSRTEDYLDKHEESNALVFGNNPLSLKIGKDGNFSLDQKTFKQQFKFYQKVAPEVIAAVYEVSGLSAPKVTIELSRSRAR